MRLGMVVPGDSVHTVAWAEEFSSAGHEVIVYAYPPVTQEWPGARVRTVESSGPIGRGRWLNSAVSQDQLDIVSIHYASTDAFLLSRLSVPLVISVWGSDILRDLENRATKRAIVTSALRRAVLVISPATHMSERLESMGVAAGRIVTAQYGVDTAALSCERTVTSGPVRVLSTRSLRPVYRVVDLVDATALMSSETVAEVRIAGDGPLAGQLRDRAEANGVADRVAFLGSLDTKEITRELCGADVYVSTSESDGTSLSLLEAMSCALPCVVTDIAANREWVDESCGVLVPVGDPQALADAVVRVAVDPELRARAGAEARRRVVERGDLRKNMAGIRAAVERSGAGA